MLGPDAPDVCIEAVGFHYMSSWLHRIESALMLETDTSEILNELIYCCRKVKPSWAQFRDMLHRTAILSCFAPSQNPTACAHPACVAHLTQCQILVQPAP